MIKRELKLAIINEKYVKFLSQAEPKVPYNSGNKKGRPFIGIIFDIENSHYFAPLSSPKEKHKYMPNNLDFLKINNGKSGVINFNNMIPVLESEIFIIEIDKIGTITGDYKTGFVITNKRIPPNKPDPKDPPNPADPPNPTDPPDPTNPPSTPQTGDKANLSLFIGMLIVSGIFLLTIIIHKIKNKKINN